MKMYNPSESMNEESMKNEAGQRLPMKECSVCLIWGVWGNYAAACPHHFPPPTKVSGVELDDQRLGLGSNYVLAPEKIVYKDTWLLSPISVPLRASKDAPLFNSFGVQLEAGQFGEAYHVLFCQLLLGASPQIEVSVQFKRNNGSTAAIEDLFHWYQLSPVEGKAPLGAVSKGEATRVIAAAFRAANEAKTDDGPGMGPIQLGQHALFQHIRDCLGPLDPKTSDLKNPQVPNRYFQPSYAAKYWLNRYFRLTGQFGRKGGRLSDMVKSNSVGRLAVIHVRRSAKSLIGREMDDVNLKHVAVSIAAANKLCRESNKLYRSQAFTHAILYGDFDFHEGCDLKERVKKNLEAEGDTTVHISFISHPWSPASNKPDALDIEVDKLWAQFRDFNVDRLPTQVKVLGIWTALRERYDDRMCVIGHRSGFVESAGLLGIPIFYLNNERGNIPGADDLKEGELLWDASAVPNPEHDRLRELADVMNTFIPVEALCAEPTREKKKSIFRVRKGFEKELTAALFAFMCCSLNSMKPAWTARVGMMHNLPDGVEHTDQDWLRERCIYAL